MKITESQLNRIVKTTIKRVLREAYDYGTPDISTGKSLDELLDVNPIDLSTEELERVNEYYAAYSGCLNHNDKRHWHDVVMELKDRNF